MLEKNLKRFSSKGYQTNSTQQRAAPEPTQGRQEGKTRVDNTITPSATTRGTDTGVGVTQTRHDVSYSGALETCAKIANQEPQ